MFWVFWVFCWLSVCHGGGLHFAFSDSNIIVGGSAPITIVNSVQQNMGAMQKRMQEERTASESESESTSSSESESESDVRRNVFLNSRVQLGKSKPKPTSEGSRGFPRKTTSNVVRNNIVSDSTVIVGGPGPTNIFNGQQDGMWINGVKVPSSGTADQGHVQQKMDALNEKMAEMQKRFKNRSQTTSRVEGNVFSGSNFIVGRNIVNGVLQEPSKATQKPFPKTSWKK